MQPQGGLVPAAPQGTCPCLKRVTIWALTKLHSRVPALLYAPAIIPSAETVRLVRAPTQSQEPAPPPPSPSASLVPTQLTLKWEHTELLASPPSPYQATMPSDLQALATDAPSPDRSAHLVVADCSFSFSSGRCSLSFENPSRAFLYSLGLLGYCCHGKICSLPHQPYAS